MKRTGAECVYLDIRAKGLDFIKSKYPFIYERCLGLGYDLSRDLLPVVPAAHYLCGGILTDEHGRTDLHGLFAAGECAQTGLHGGNRLASNSLLECLAFAEYAYQHIGKHAGDYGPVQVVQTAPPIPLRKESDDEFMLISHLWHEIRTCMWNYVGIVRSNKRLQRASARIANIEAEIEEYYREFQAHSDIVELRNLAQVARLTIQCALQRRHSVGTHFNVDLPSAPEGQAQMLNVYSTAPGLLPLLDQIPGSTL
jgi:L-aspartate oxidase